MRRHITIALVLAISACKSSSELEPFSSDGCTLFPDTSLISKKDWRECCFDHDVAYWMGGTREQRETADLALKHCVLDKTGDEELASLMYEGVRFGGSPYFYNWYRWGYGWGFERKYQQLLPDELERAEQLLQQYYESLQEKAEMIERG